MAKERLINTRFWNDNWVRHINPLDRYLFLYLLTNEYTNICGIYELPISTIAYGSGLDERDLEKVMLPRLQPKVYYHEGWVIITNFVKYQRIKSESVKEGIKKAIEQAPKSIIDYATGVGYGDGMGIIPTSSHILESESESELELESEPIAETSSALIPNLIKLFEEINPTCKTYYSNTTQRKACQFLIDTYGFEKVGKVITELLPQTNGMGYLPTITTPVQLKDKWSQLEAAVKKEGTKIKSKGNVYW